MFFSRPISTTTFSRSFRFCFASDSVRKVSIIEIFTVPPGFKNPSSMLDLTISVRASFTFRPSSATWSSIFLASSFIALLRTTSLLSFTKSIKDGLIWTRIASRYASGASFSASCLSGSFGSVVAEDVSSLIDGFVVISVSFFSDLPHPQSPMIIVADTMKASARFIFCLLLFMNLPPFRAFRSNDYVFILALELMEEFNRQ